MTALLLRSTRKLLGMDLKEMSAALGLSPASVHLMERRKMKISERSRDLFRNRIVKICLRRSELLRKRAEELG